MGLTSKYRRCVESSVREEEKVMGPKRGSESRASRRR